MLLELLPRGKRNILLLLDVILQSKCNTLTLSELLAAHLVATGTRLLLRGKRITLLLLDFMLRGRCSTLTLWKVLERAWSPLGPSCFCVAGLLLRGRCNVVGTVDEPLVAAGPRLLLPGRRSVWCFWSCFRGAGAACGALGATLNYFCVLISHNSTHSTHPT